MAENSRPPLSELMLLPRSLVATQRLLLGVTLRHWRKKAGLSGTELAQRTNLSQAKVSNLERGIRLPTLDDADRLAKALQLTEEDTVAFREQVRTLQTQVQGYRNLARTGFESLQTTIQDRQTNARDIALYADTLVPGLLQTAAYARAVFERIPGLGEDAISAATAARVERQSAVFDVRRRFTFVVNEGALRRPLLPLMGMLEQFDRIRTITTVPTVTMLLIPWWARPSIAPPTQSFQVYDREFVVIETLSAEITLTDPDDVRLYTDFIDAMAACAIPWLEMSRYLDGIAAELRAREEGKPIE